MPDLESIASSSASSWSSSEGCLPPLRVATFAYSRDTGSSDSIFSSSNASSESIPNAPAVAAENPDRLATAPADYATHALNAALETPALQYGNLSAPVLLRTAPLVPVIQEVPPPSHTWSSETHARSRNDSILRWRVHQ
ncbi:unnamed protein product [Peniophora sp. CBMAI 1063]|nr:unnamed protein product [Peniophora sp. CBMAI 1063]